MGYYTVYAIIIIIYNMIQQLRHPPGTNSTLLLTDWRHQSKQQWHTCEVRRVINRPLPWWPHRVSHSIGCHCQVAVCIIYSDILFNCDPDHQQNICSSDDMSGIQNISLLVISVKKTSLMILKLVMTLTHKKQKTYDSLICKYLAFVTHGQ